MKKFITVLTLCAFSCTFSQESRWKFENSRESSIAYITSSIPPGIWCSTETYLINMYWKISCLEWEYETELKTFKAKTKKDKIIIQTILTNLKEERKYIKNFQEKFAKSNKKMILINVLD